jgi:hypothetical protein
MTVLYEAQDRITYAFEGAVLAAEDAFDVVRDRTAIALTAVLAVLVTAAAVLLLSGGGGGEATSPQAAKGSAGSVTGEPVLIDETGFSLSLPAGWERVDPPKGASFAADSADGLAKTTLWAERAPGLGFEAFVAQSMDNLDEIGTNVRISDEVDGPTLTSRITELRAEVPLDGGLSAAYHVVLRADGPFRYYLATSLQPGATPQLLADSELLGTSFRPQVVSDQGE